MGRIRAYRAGEKAAVRARARDHQAGKRSAEDEHLHGRLLNWRDWASGGLPHLALSTRTDRPGTVNEADALELEQALRIMRTRRRLYFALVDVRYLRRFSPPEQRGALGDPGRPLTRRQLHELSRAMFRWLHGTLEALEEVGSDGQGPGFR